MLLLAAAVAAAGGGEAACAGSSMENYPLYGEAHAALSQNCEETHTRTQKTKKEDEISGFLTSCCWLFLHTLCVEEFLHLCTASTNGNQSLFSSHLDVKRALF